MRLPSSVPIAGRVCQVTTGEGTDASYCRKTGTIVLGGKNESKMAELFIHEVLEAILFERGHEYYIYAGDTNEKLLFNMNHAEYDNVCKDLALALKGVKF